MILFPLRCAIIQTISVQNQNGHLEAGYEEQQEDRKRFLSLRGGILYHCDHQRL